jgi:ATP-dependent DNA helicase RecG
MQAIDVRNEEQELMVESFRVGVPRYDRLGVREAINNALIHRDYGMLGAVHVQIHDEELIVSNPGGFVAGVRLNNLLVVAPRPRNPLLADIFRRIGLVERTGRGVDRVYIGQLRNGRILPDYTPSTESNVTVALDSSPADLNFVLLAIRVNQRLGHNLRVEDLLALWEMWHHRTTTPETLSAFIQRDVAYARRVLDSLHEHEIVQLRDSETYGLAPELKTTSSTPLVPQAAILAHVQAQGRITRSEAAELCGLTSRQAAYQLKQLVESGHLILVGAGRGAYYTLAK